jgi:hypothetical protein
MFDHGLTHQKARWRSNAPLLRLPQRRHTHDHLFQSGAILETGCWAHERRKLYDAKENGPTRAHAAMAHIRRLYAIETKARERIAARQLAGANADAVRFESRQRQSSHELSALQTLLQAEQRKVVPKSLIGLAIAYALKHWHALTRNLTDGFLDIDNNIAERTLRHIAVGGTVCRQRLRRSNRSDAVQRHIELS